jgi:hypothetical protein
VSVSKTSGTNLLLECIFSNLFGLQAGFFEVPLQRSQPNKVVAKVVTDQTQSGGKINLESLQIVSSER